MAHKVTLGPTSPGYEIQAGDYLDVQIRTIPPLDSRVAIVDGGSLVQDNPTDSRKFGVRINFTDATSTATLTDQGAKVIQDGNKYPQSEGKWYRSLGDLAAYVGRTVLNFEIWIAEFAAAGSSLETPFINSTRYLFDLKYVGIRKAGGGYPCRAWIPGDPLIYGTIVYDFSFEPTITYSGIFGITKMNDIALPPNQGEPFQQVNVGAGGSQFQPYGTSELGGDRVQISDGFVVGGSLQIPLMKVAANRTLSELLDHSILVDATGGARTITLPVPGLAIAGLEFMVKRVNSGANTVTLAASAGKTIDGAATIVLSAQYAAVTVRCDGANWVIVSKYL